MHHLLQFAGRVGAVLTGQPPVLLVDELQLRQPLVDLPLEGLRPGVGGISATAPGCQDIPSRPQATCLKGPSPNERHESLASPILLMLPENSLLRSWPGGQHKPVMSCKAAGAVDADWAALTRAGEACHSWEDPVAIPEPSESPVLGSTGWKGRWGRGVGSLPQTSSALPWQLCTTPRRNSDRPLSSQRP